MDIIEKTRADYDAIAPYFSATRRRVWPEFKEFTRYFRNGQRILDWGCGNGRLLSMLAGKGIEYFGVDQSRELLKYARRINRAAIQSGEAHFYCTARREKKFPRNFFDLVFMIASFFHLPDEASRSRLLKKIFYETKPGGRLYISVWNLGSRWAAKKKRHWKQIGPADFLIPWKDTSGQVLVERYYHHFTGPELVRYMADAGFSLERLYYTAGEGYSDDKGGRNLVAIGRKPKSS